jgi:hypothetical protein
MSEVKQRRTNQFEFIKHLLDVAGTHPECSRICVICEHAKVRREAFSYNQLQKLSGWTPFIDPLLICKLHLYKSQAFAFVKQAAQES